MAMQLGYGIVDISKIESKRLGSHHVEKWCLGNDGKSATPGTNMKELYSCVKTQF